MIVFFSFSREFLILMPRRLKDTMLHAKNILKPIPEKDAYDSLCYSDLCGMLDNIVY